MWLWFQAPKTLVLPFPLIRLKRRLSRLKARGRIINPYLGVRYVIITPDLAKKEKLPVEDGALVRGSGDNPAVLPNSPAAKAGLLAEDIIIEMNGEKITQDNHLGKIIQKYNVGDVIVLKILRKGKEMELKATLEERPKNL